MQDTLTSRILNQRAWQEKPEAKAKSLPTDPALLPEVPLMPKGIVMERRLLIDIQRAMIQAARKVIFCIDSTKFGRQSITKLCDLQTIDTIVTDKAAPANLVRALRKQGAEVIVAPDE